MESPRAALIYSAFTANFKVLNRKNISHTYTHALAYSHSHYTLSNMQRNFCWLLCSGIKNGCSLACGFASLFALAFLSWFPFLVFSFPFLILIKNCIFIKVREGGAEQFCRNNRKTKNTCGRQTQTHVHIPHTHIFPSTLTNTYTHTHTEIYFCEQKDFVDRTLQ